MYGYDLSSRRRMLNRGLYCLMKFCSASSASALGVHDQRLDLVDHVDQITAATDIRTPPAPGEVRRDPLADRDRLPDVDHLPAPVAEQVHAGLVGELAAPVGWDY